MLPILMKKRIKFLKAYYYFKINDYDNAIVFAKKGIDLESNNINAFNLVSDSYIRLKNYEEAMNYCNKAKNRSKE